MRGQYKFCFYDPAKSGLHAKWLKLYGISKKPAVRQDGWLFWCAAEAGGLHVKSEQDDIPILHDVFLALGAHKAFFLGGGH